MARAFIAIGSNINSAENVRAAIQRLARQTRLSAISMVYRSGALGRPEQPPYYNCVVEIETDAPPAEVKYGMLRRIEEDLGRRRTNDKYAARTIDLDLIVYGDLALDTPDLKLPDPEILERPFLAIPLFELAPELVLPGYGRRIGEIAARLARDGMQPLQDYAALLRKDVVSADYTGQASAHSASPPEYI